MLFLWRTRMSAAMATKRVKYVGAALKIHPESGMETVAVIVAGEIKDHRPVIRRGPAKTINQIPTGTKATCHGNSPTEASPMRTPKPLATHFPSEKRRSNRKIQIEKACPSITRKHAETTIQGFGTRACDINTTTTAFPASRTRVIKPSRGPPVRNTLMAPVLCEP